MQGMPGMLGVSGHAAGHGPQLLPEWVALAWSALFLLVAASHLRHMAHSRGQRRPWHSCHVLMALGMAFMYLPAQLDPVAAPAGFWRIVFACAGVLTASWSIAGVGRNATLIWLLTSIDLGAMLYMWAGPSRASAAAVGWLVVSYLLAEAAVWGLDLYRRLDGSSPLVSWRLLPGPEGATVIRAVSGGGGGGATLLGELDISISMVTMTVGMAYMVAAMQLMH